jgi:hypothetical protein
MVKVCTTGILGNGQMRKIMVDLSKGLGGNTGRSIDQLHHTGFEHLQH